MVMVGDDGRDMAWRCVSHNGMRSTGSGKIFRRSGPPYRDKWIATCWWDESACSSHVATTQLPPLFNANLMTNVSWGEGPVHLGSQVPRVPTFSNLTRPINIWLIVIWSWLFCVRKLRNSCWGLGLVFLLQPNSQHECQVSPPKSVVM